MIDISWSHVLAGITGCLIGMTAMITASLFTGHEPKNPAHHTDIYHSPWTRT
jgi:hypothetical protein